MYVGSGIVAGAVTTTAVLVNTGAKGIYGIIAVACGIIAGVAIISIVSRSAAKRG